MNVQVSAVKCASYAPETVLESVRKAVGLLGGAAAFIKPGSSVLVKPNLLSAEEPERGVTTHPEVVRAVIKILKEIDCKVYLGDSPSVWGEQSENPERVYEKSGMTKLAGEEGVQLVRFDKRRWMGKFPLTAWLDDCDYFVNVPKFKTHSFTILTGAVKNLFGLVAGTYKTELHKKYFGIKEFANIIVDIYQAARPALTVVDGIVAMEGDGPASGGKLRNTNLVLAGSDCVALDSVLALIMGLKPSDIPTTREAARRDLGVAEIGSINILGEKLESIIAGPFLLPSAPLDKKIPRPVIDIAKQLLKHYPCVERDNCTGCAACIRACPGKAISAKSGRIVFNYSRCIACFCCIESCPSSAIKIKRSLLAKMMKL